MIGMFVGFIVGFVAGSLLTKAEKTRDLIEYKTALEEIAYGQHDMNKLVSIAIKALAENK